MTIKTAIEKAGSAGYFEHTTQSLIDLPEYAKNQIWMDVEFWRALGKAVPSIGVDDQWKATTCTCGGADFHIAMDGHYDGCARLKCPRGWHWVWLRMIDHLAKGGTVEGYFDKL